MKPRRYLANVVTRALTSSRRRAASHAIAEWRRRIAGRPHRVEYFHQVDDPYSHLAAQALRALCESYEIELVPHLVGPPSAEAAAEPELLEVYARKDAAGIAPHYGLAFADPGKHPAAAQVRLAQRILATALDGARFAELALETGRALWAGDARALTALAAAHEAATESATEECLDTGNRRRRRLRHYLGAMFWYGGEWYWGVDRLHHLERRLRALGVARAGITGLRFPTPEATKSDVRDTGTLKLEYYPSLRSPYTAISMRRTRELARRSGVKLVLRPVMPMVMRGVPVPLPKRLYIAMDTKREADLAGVPFGNMCDPVGKPVERGFSLYPWARDHGKGAELLQSFIDGAFAEGIDTGTDEGLKRVVERIGLSWSEAEKIVDNEDWRAELEENRQAMYAMGVWGVPSFRLSGPEGSDDFVAWGQDRLWLLEKEIQRRLEGGRP